jgi:UDP-glucose:(heptosyl)LPS alpha-1,3-glucosyltransferase
MHIALVYPSCHRRGGVERVVWEAAQFLALRHQVTLVGLAGAATDVAPEVAVVGVRVPRRAGVLTPLAFRWAAGRALARLTPDVTVSFGFDCPPGDVLVVGSVHAAWIESGGAVTYGRWTIPAAFRRLLPRHQVRLVLERLTMGRRRPATLIAVSAQVADDLVRLYGCPPGAVQIVPNGFDPEQCSPERRRQLRPAARSDAGVNGSEPVLLMVANEWHRKGLGVLVDAVGRLPRPSPVIVLVGREAPTLYRDQITASGLEGRVRYLGAMEDIAAAYAVGDLLVLPTQYEPFGMVIVEALACGLPVLTTTRAGASRTVHAGENGLLLQDPHDAVERQGLRARARAAGPRARWAATAPAAVTGYDWPAVMARLEAAIVTSGAIGEPVPVPAPDGR